jgi:hypothetical protein
VEQNGSWENIMVRENLKKPCDFGLYKNKSLIDHEFLIFVDRDFLSIKHLTATTMAYSNSVFINEYYDKIINPKMSLVWLRKMGRT